MIGKSKAGLVMAFWRNQECILPDPNGGNKCGTDSPGRWDGVAAGLANSPDITGTIRRVF